LESYANGNDRERWHGHELHAANFAARDFFAGRGLAGKSPHKGAVARSAELFIDA